MEWLEWNGILAKKRKVTCFFSLSAWKLRVNLINPFMDTLALMSSNTTGLNKSHRVNQAML